MKNLILLATIALFSTTFFANSAFAKTKNFYIQGIKFTLHYDKHEKPLIFLVHGCLQDEQKVFNLAKANEFLKDFHILTPKQKYSYNPNQCWNWFLRHNQYGLYFSETNTFKMAIEKVLKMKQVASPVTTIGISSGAAQLTNLYFNFPELIQNQILIAGLPFRPNNSAFDAQRVMAEPYPTSVEVEFKRLKNHFNKKPSLNRTNTFLIHGNEDEVVQVQNHEQAILQHLVYQTECNTKNCLETKIKKQSFPYFVDIQKTKYTIGFNQVTSFRVSEMGHAWPGGAENQDFSAPRKKNIVKQILENLIKH